MTDTAATMANPTSATSAVERVRERQKLELDYVHTIGRERQKVDTLEATITTHWANAAAAMRGLTTLGWSAKQIAEVVNLDTRRVSSLLKAHGGGGDNAKSATIPNGKA